MKKEKIYFVGEFLLSFKGGAEKSIFNYLQSIRSKYDIECITFDIDYKEGKFKRDGIVIYNYHFPIITRFSRFYQLFLNYNFIKKILEKHRIQKNQRVLTQTLIVPAVAEFCFENNIKYTYFVRDELNLNYFKNYFTGFAYFAKAVKDIFEFPFKKFYKSNNKIALENANKIVSNSNYVRNYIKENFNLESKVIYPKKNKLDKRKFRKKYAPRFITFVGAYNYYKGYDIALKIANKMGHHNFLFISQNKINEFDKGNIKYRNWEKSFEDVLKVTKVLIVPSKWVEFYGRVVIEARDLGIPVITSNKGGLTEANKNKDLIIKNYEDVDSWVNKIRGVLDER